MAGKIGKNKQGYGYKYTDLAHIHDYLEQIGATYYQYIERVEGDDYVFTVPTIDGKELAPRRGCRVVQATLSGKNNPAQEQGSALTYARRYSLLMAFGLATDDDDGEALTVKKETPKAKRTFDEAPTDDGAPVEKVQTDAIQVLLTDAPATRLEAFNKALDFYHVENISQLTKAQAAQLIARLRTYK